LSLCQTRTDNPHDIDRETRIAVDQRQKIRFAPKEYQRRFGGDGIGGKQVISEEWHRPEHLALSDKADDDLSAVTSSLDDANTSRSQCVCAPGHAALFKDQFVLANMLHAGQGADRIDTFGCNPGE